jgi:hypothetical protein
MTDDVDVLARLTDYHDHIAAPAVPVTDDVRRGRHRVARKRTLIAGGVALAAAGVVLTASLVTRSDQDNPPPEPAPSPTQKKTAIDRVVIPDGPSDVLGARQTGRFRMEVGGKVVPGRWTLDRSRGDVWTAGFYDEVGYSSPALWWGTGTTTHEVPGQRGGVAISQDAHWIVWTRAASGEYQDSTGPRVMEVVDTATGEVHWSRDADADAPEIGALSVTNDGVVVLGRCLESFRDVIGVPQCNDARIDVWVPQTGRTETVPAEVEVYESTVGPIDGLTPLVQVTGAHNGLLVRETESGRPTYVRVSERGEVEVVATLPRTTMAVTADERFALLATVCPGPGDLVCRWSALPLDGGAPRPIHSLSEIVTIATEYDWPVEPARSGARCHSRAAAP